MSVELGVFADLDPAEVLARTADHWNLEGPLPIPHDGWLACPVCGHREVQVRYWMFHTRPGRATIRYRCDVRFKCTMCAAIWTHGVALPNTYYRRHGQGREKKRIGWREARRLLGAG